MTVVTIEQEDLPGHRCLGRHNSESPVHCAACDWHGSLKQVVHKYRLNSQQEIEPADFCPECNAPLTQGDL